MYLLISVKLIFFIFCWLLVSTDHIEASHNHSNSSHIYTGTDVLAKIHATYQQIVDTANIRNQISDAVNNNFYAHGDKPHDKVTTPKPHFSLLHFFSLFGENHAIGEQKHLSTAFNLNDNDEKIHKKIEQTFENVNLGDIEINTKNDEEEPYELQVHAINSNLESYDENLYPFTKRNSNSQKELLKIVSITENLTFSLGQNVLAWKTISRKSYVEHTLIGQTKSTIIVAIEKNGTYQIVKQHKLNSTIMDFDVFSHWNEQENQIENVIVVAIENKIIFIKLYNNLRSSDIVWVWSIQKTITTIKYFKTNHIDNLLLIIDSNNNHNVTSANIYQFNVKTKHTWLFQMIPLDTPSRRIDVLDTGRDMVLCLCQIDTIILYKLNIESGINGRYEELMKIKSKNVNTVVGFQMGGHSYIAIGGLKPEILRYHRGQFIAQTILSQTWGLVEEFIPVVARTYRDDLILLVQHRIHFDTHSLSAVEALIWDGESFDTSLSVPCHIDTKVFSHGLTCILDLSRNEGIYGTAVIQSTDNISILVPRFKAPSGLFHLNITLQPTTDTIVGAAYGGDILKHFHEILQYQKSLTKIEKSINNSLSAADLTQEIESIQFVREAKAAEYIVTNPNDVKINKIYFGDQEWAHEDEEISIINLLENVQEVLKELEILEEHFYADTVKLVTNSPVNGKFNLENIRILPKRSTLQSESNKSFDNLHVENLTVNFINDVPVEKYVFLHNNNLKFNGTLVFDNDLDIIKQVMVKDPLILNQQTDERIDTKLETAKDINVDTLHIVGDINVQFINGIFWNDFLNRIVMTNLPNTLQSLVLKGNIIVNDTFTISTLNHQAFPLGFLWKNGPRDSTIKGRKNFTATLKTNALDCSGKISDVNTFDVITLSQTQIIPGLTTFKQIEVSETLEVNGSVSGRQLDNFLANPSILQTKLIRAETIFQSLIVEGPLYIYDDCNGTNLDEILSNVVYKSVEKIILPSFKSFNFVDITNIELTSNLVNGIEVDRYLTTDTEQDIRIDRVIGNVFVKNLIIGGLYDFINITEMDENAIKLHGEQYTGAELIFDDQIGKLTVNNIEVIKSCNGHQIDDFVLIDEELQLDGKVIVDNVRVDDLIVEGDVKGKKINGIIIEEFDNVRLSRTKKQTLTKMCHIKMAVIQNGLYSQRINGYDINELQKHYNNIRDIRKHLSSDNVRLENLIINGSVFVAEVNGHNFDSIIDNAIWLNKPNIISGNVAFTNRPIFAKEIIVDNLNDVSFSHFVSNLVLQNFTDITFKSTKSFTEPIHIAGDILATELNEMKAKNILAKCFENEIQARFNVIGSIIVENIILSKNLNDILFSEIANVYDFDVKHQLHVLKKNVNFNIISKVKNLQLNSGLNNVENVQTFINNIIRKDQSGAIFGQKAFKSNTYFGKDVFVHRHNEIDVLAFLHDILLIDGTANNKVIKNVAFEDKVTAPSIEISNIMAKSIMGCSIEEWMKNALRTDLPVTIAETLLYPRGTFKTSNINLVYLNGQSFSDVFTLHTDQKFNGVLRFSEIYSHHENNVTGTVNGVNLQKERENTVMVFGDHHITAPTSVQWSRVLNTMVTNGTVNDIHIDCISLHEDVHLEGPITFNSINVKNLYTNDEISGINFNQWYENSVWKTGRGVQQVVANWTINDAIMHASINGNGDINGVQIQNLSNRIFSHTPQITDNLQEFHKDYQEVCTNLSNLVINTQKDLYSLSHFDVAFKVQETLPITSFYSFAMNNQNYLLINFGCKTKLYIWNTFERNFNYLSEFSTGTVDTFIYVTDANNKWYLLSNSASSNKICNVSGLNIWNFDGYNLKLFSKLKPYNIIQKHYNHLGRFYALHQENSTVYDLDLDGNMIEKWHLPSDGYKLRFIPNEANLGLALSDGNLLSILSSIKPRIERTSQWIENLPEEFNQDKFIEKRFFFSDDTNSQIQSVKDKYVLSQHAKLKAMSLAGPFTNISIGRNLEFFNDVLGNTAHNEFQNKGVHLKIEPTENIKQSNKPYFQRLYDKKRIENEKSTEIMTENPMVENNFEQIMSSEPTLGDTFGELEELSKRIGDELVDTIVDLNSDTHGAVKDTITNLVDIGESLYEDYHDGGGFLGSQNGITMKSLTTENGGLINTKDPIVGDTFGVFEELSKRIADELVDTIADIDSDTDGAVAGVIDDLIDVVEPLYADYHDHNDFLGSSKIQTTTDPIVGDTFGELEELSKKIFEDLVDTMVELDDDTDGAIAGIVDGAIDIAEPLYQDYHDKNDFLGSEKSIEPVNLTKEDQHKHLIDSQLGGTISHIANSVKDSVSHGYHKSKEYIQNKLHINHHGIKSNESQQNNQSYNLKHHNETAHNITTHNSTHLNPHSHHHHHHHHHHHLPHHLIHQHSSDSRAHIDDKYLEIPSDEYVRTINAEVPPSNYSNFISNQNVSLKAISSIPMEYNKDHLPTIPRITFNKDDMLLENSSSLELHDIISATTISTFREKTISKEIKSGGLVTAENKYLPGYGKQEVSVLKIGNTGKTFIAVSMLKENVVQGLHDSILIYEDILSGKIFQTLSCQRPRSLTTFNLRDETILAFIENDVEIQIFVYRGIQGFTLFNSLKMHTHIKQMTAVSLSFSNLPKCPAKYLTITMSDEIWFLEAKTTGNCFDNVNIKC